MNADRGIDGNADSVHDVEQFFVRPDAGAAARQIVTDAFEDPHLPADRLEKIRCEQAA
jgi:hypothetical protein